VRASTLPFVTSPGCDLEAFFRKRSVNYVLACRFTLEHEYQQVERFYGDRTAERSGVYFMNHVDEGLAVLHHIGATERAKRAFCLHPLLQNDADLVGSYPRAAELTRDPQVLLLAMEYRNIANASLSHRTLSGPSDIPLGPLDEVRQMLVADKIQNAKDFILHHRSTHARSSELERYFRLWLERLDISRARFAKSFERLQVGQGAKPLPSDWPAH
jgi:hypothetical protein